MDTRLQTVLAAVIGLGLACLAGYFGIRGLSHCCRAGGARRWLFAAGMIADALIYGAVMISLLGLAFRWHPDGERETQVWTAWGLSQPFGRAIVGFVGLVILGCGIGVVAWAMTTDVDDDVDLPEDEKRLIEPVARYRLAGRGVGAALVGIYWLSAGIHGEPSKAHELGGALQTVQQNSRGWLLLLPRGVAFAASALFDFIEALYHWPHEAGPEERPRRAGRSLGTAMADHALTLERKYTRVAATRQLHSLAQPTSVTGVTLGWLPRRTLIYPNVPAPLPWTRFADIALIQCGAGSRCTRTAPLCVSGQFRTSVRPSQAAAE
jgi:hypothetical protein